MKKLQGKITISKCSDGKININIEDVNSRINFFSGSMKLVDFAEAITGLSYMPIKFEAKGLESVGRFKQIKPLIFEIEHSYTTEHKQAEDNCQKYADEGWIAYNYFRSQNSFFTKDGKRYASTNQYRYVDSE